MKAKSNTCEALEVCPTYGDWMLIFDPKDPGPKWHINVMLRDATHQIGNKFYTCKVDAVSPRIWRVWHDDHCLTLDCRMTVEDFIAHLKSNPELAVVARIFFALRHATSELKTQLTPIDGDYTNVVEALEKHREWANEPDWFSELIPK